MSDGLGFSWMRPGDSSDHTIVFFFLTWYADFPSQFRQAIFVLATSPENVDFVSSPDSQDDSHDDKLAGHYFSAVFLHVRNVSAFSIQLCWRPAECAGSFVA